MKIRLKTNYTSIKFFKINKNLNKKSKENVSLPSKASKQQFLCRGVNMTFSFYQSHFDENLILAPSKFLSIQLYTFILELGGKKKITKRLVFQSQSFNS